ncbi:MATE family efflux transporter [Ruminococcus albus]|uniref:Probable multidrug resistance protein NorM n=1 Tax=Ruminococcus albus TaxID=1264 RepID=A0A1H7J5N0_RUMAL|nr:MATE family efflux transporter [Ruminococcus albus]SEK69492.1 putative efflux protein, MATE family [Ruminococcus albus]
MYTKFREKYLGDKAFYKRVLITVIPMILQNLVTNFVSMMDNIMVGQVGTEQMSGVSIVNQFIFVFNITVFGAVAGPGIFGAQFFGKRDAEGQRYTVRFKLMICTAIIVIGALVFSLLDEPLIRLFISEDDSPEKMALTMQSAKAYMKIMIIGLIPFGYGQAYSSTLRECSITTIPMISSLSAVGVNLVLDYGLIFGKLGMPEMGVRGAAVATVIAKLIEAGVVIFWTHTHNDRNPYAVGLFKSFTIPRKLLKDIIIKGSPLLVNEFLWAAGMAVVAQCYSERGLDVVAARNISGTITNLFGSVYIQLGCCIGIIVGAELGANKLDEARRTDDKLRFFSIAATLLLAAAVIPLAPLFPKIYKTEDSIRSLASYMIIIQALTMPLWSYTNACYFTLRSGGKTILTFLFDFVFTWALVIPISFIIAHFTKMDIHPMFAIISFTEIIKVVIGYFMVRSDIWINNIVNEKS